MNEDLERRVGYMEGKLDTIEKDLPAMIVQALRPEMENICKIVGRKHKVQITVSAFFGMIGGFMSGLINKSGG